MQKSLAIFLLTACTAYAEVQAPSLKINGFTAIGVSAASQRKKDDGKGGGVPHVSLGASDLYFTVSGTAENGLQYSYRVNFEAVPGANPYVNRNYIELKGTFGAFQIGATPGAEEKVQMAPDLLGGGGGPTGSLSGVMNLAAGVIASDGLVARTKKATKISFYSPIVSGFQLGVSYTPNTSHMGTSNKNNSRAGTDRKAGNLSAVYPNKEKMPFGRRNIALALFYTGDYGTWSYHLSAAFVHEKTILTITENSQERTPMRDGRAYQLGASVTYGNWKVGGGYIDNGKSRLPKVAVKDLGNTHLGNAGKAWNIGLNYTTGPYQVATAFFRTDRKTDAVGKASSDILMTTIDCVVAQGFKVYGEFDVFRSRTSAGAASVHQTFLDSEKKGEKAVRSNTGTAVILGTKISF